MKAILVIDVLDDVAEAYEDITVDYDLRGRPKEDGFYTESIKYVEDCPLKPMPKAKRLDTKDLIANTENAGWNACLEEVFGNNE